MKRFLFDRTQNTLHILAVILWIRLSDAVEMENWGLDFAAGVAILIALSTAVNLATEMFYDGPADLRRAIWGQAVMVATKDVPEQVIPKPGEQLLKDLEKLKPYTGITLELTADGVIVRRPQEDEDNNA